MRRTAEGDAAAARLAELLEQVEATWAERVGAHRYRQFRAVLDEIADLR